VRGKGGGLAPPQHSKTRSAVRRKVHAPGHDGVQQRIQRGGLLLDAGFDIHRDQPLGVLRRRVPLKIERNERQRCLIKKPGSEALVALGTRETAESPRRDHRPAMILRIIAHVRRRSR
jgi:hypothetical protein